MTGVSASVLSQASLKITVAGFTIHLTRPCPPKGSRHGDRQCQSQAHSRADPSSPIPIIICWIKRDRPQDSVEIDGDHFTELGMGTGTGATGMASSPSCLSLAWQIPNIFYNCNGHVSPNTRPTSNVSLKFQQTIPPEFGRKLTSKS